MFSNHCPWARMGKLPPWGSLPIDGGVGWAIIMILLVSVPVEGLLKTMPQVNLLLVTIWLEAWGQVGCVR